MVADQTAQKKAISRASRYAIVFFLILFAFLVGFFIGRNAALENVLFSLRLKGIEASHTYSLSKEQVPAASNQHFSDLLISLCSNSQWPSYCMAIGEHYAEEEEPCIAQDWIKAAIVAEEKYFSLHSHELGNEPMDSGWRRVLDGIEKLCARKVKK